MKKKKFFSFLLVISIITSIFAGTISAEAATSGDYEYSVNADGTTCTISSSDDYKTQFSGDLTIPSELDGYKVTAIQLGAFSNCDNLQSVTIPGSIESIGYFTFAECDNLQSITLLEGVKTIESEALRYSSLKSISIPASVTTLSGGSFYACKSLTSITVDADNMNYVTQDGVLYNKDKTTLICYPDAHPGKVFNIPAGVTTISGAFEFNSILTDITIPDSVTTIDGAFYDCSKLTGVIIPSSVTSIGNQTFYSCDALTYVTIPSSVTSIGYGAFQDCTALNSVTIPSSVTSIEGATFSGCSGLTSVYFDGLVATLSSIAFDGLSPAPTYYCPTENKDKFTAITMTPKVTNTITVSSTANGTITPSTTSGMPGETISFKITPATGYILKPDSLKYNDGSDDITITGTSITMPDNAITISAVFEDSTPLVVSGVTPTGTGVSIGGNTVITFSEAINTTGTVSLDGGSTSLTGGSWSADKLTYTIPYSGLSYSTAYTVAISGFKDAAGNTMTADSSHGFTTMATPPAMVLGTSGIAAGDHVYYGTDSVYYRVLSTTGNDGTYVNDSGTSVSNPMLLISEYLLDNGNVKFNSSVSSNAWQGSSAQTWCTTFASMANFSATELAAIAKTAKSDHAFTSSTFSVPFSQSTNILSGDKAFFLSVEEAETYFNSDKARIAKIGSSTGAAGLWLLRSPSAGNPYAGVVYNTGDVDIITVDYGLSARPAFNLNLNSVLFSSAAEGGKSSGTIGAAALNLVSSTTPTDWKVTLTDSSRSFAVTNTTAQTVAQGANASVSYTGATVGANEYVSAMIVDGSNNILYYGRIKAATAAGDAGGTADITIPAGLTAGNYTLKLFSEQYNGDKKTDYTSAFSNVALTVKTPPVVSGVTPNGTGVSIGGNIAITFSEAMNTTGTVSLDGGSTSLTGGSWSADKLTYTIPYSGLAYSTAYTVAISGFEDTANCVMTADSTHSFTTIAAPDTTKPTVSTVTPTGTGVSIGGNIVITFNEAMNTTAGAVSLNGGTTLTGGSWSADKLTYTIPYSGLLYSTAYTVSISGFEDTANNTMTADSTHTFTTEAAPDATKPTVFTVTPSGTGISIGGNIVITFNEAMNTTAGAVSLDGGSTFLTGGSWSADKLTYMIPYSGLSHSTAYTVAIYGFEDMANNTMTADSTHSFATEAAPASGGGGSSNTSTPSYKADVSNTGSSGTTLPVNVNTSAGSAAVDLGTPGEGLFTGKEAMITIPSIPGVKTYTLDISASSLSSSQGDGSLTFTTGTGSITLPDNMLSGISGTEGKKAGISIGQGDKSVLPDRVKTAIGDRPLVQLTLTLNGTQTAWNNPDAPVTASIPYTPTAAELADPEHITVWYIDGDGNAVLVPSGRYNAATDMVTFSTTHFSNYAVVYVTKTFDDLGSVAWAKTQIEVLASKGILKGTSETAYSPQMSITRADFLYYLVRTLGVDAVTDGNFDDISSNAYYCKEIAIAKKLGITTGTGSNKFDPDASITRQDMIVMTERALKLLNRIEVQGTTSDLDKFADRSLIASYAVNSVASAVKEGLIVGSGDKVNPLGNTTRAEAAVFLYRIYNNYPG